jgi:hypothetical protein
MFEDSHVNISAMRGPIRAKSAIRQGICVSLRVSA